MSDLTPECIKFYDVKYQSYVFIAKEACSIKEHKTSRGLKYRLTGEYTHTDGEFRRVSKFISKDFKL